MLRHRLRIATAIVVAAFTTLALTPGVSGASDPAAGISFDGTSAHGLFTVAMPTSCVNNDSTITAVCVKPSYVSIEITPTAKLSSRCLGYGLSMGYIALKSKDAFSVKYYNQGNYDETVSGRFVSPQAVSGTITSVGPSCKSDSFHIAIAAPISPLSPCEILVKTSAVRVLAGSAKAAIGQNDFTNASGDCQINVASVSSLELGLRPLRGALPVMIGGLTSAPVGGLSSGATVYTSATSNFFDVVVVFHHGTTWAGLTYDYQQKPCPSTFTGSETCVPVRVQSSIRLHTLEVARKILPLL